MFHSVVYQNMVIAYDFWVQAPMEPSKVGGWSRHTTRKALKGMFYKGSAGSVPAGLLLNRIARDPSFSPRPEPESTKRNAKVGRRRKAA